MLVGGLSVGGAVTGAEEAGEVIGVSARPQVAGSGWEAVRGTLYQCPAPARRAAIKWRDPERLGYCWVRTGTQWSSVLRTGSRSQHRQDVRGTSARSGTRNPLVPG